MKADKVIPCVHVFSPNELAITTIFLLDGDIHTTLKHSKSLENWNIYIEIYEFKSFKTA